jgi:lipopolysaccharide export system permease protein
MLFRYLAQVYLRYFFLVFLALELFYVGIDFLQNLKTIPDSANLAILYIAYMFVVAVKVTLPLSIIFSLIATMMYLVRANELVAFYAIGYTKRDIIKPFLFVSTLFIFLQILLNTSQAAYFAERAMSIRDNHYMSSSTSHLFFKLDNELVYMEKLLPFEKKATNIRVFKFREDRLVEAIYAENALFLDNRWKLFNCKHLQVTTNPSGHDVLRISTSKELNHLEGFRPKILDNIFEGRGNFSVWDAASALILLDDVAINLDKVKAALYIHVFIPFFAPLFIVFLVYFFPLSGRFSNMMSIAVASILSSLMIWGFFWVLQTLAMSGAASSEILIIMPIVLLALLSFYYFRKLNN